MYLFVIGISYTVVSGNCCAIPDYIYAFNWWLLELPELFLCSFWGYFVELNEIWNMAGCLEKNKRSLQEMMALSAVQIHSVILFINTSTKLRTTNVIG